MKWSGSGEEAAINTGKIRTLLRRADHVKSEIKFGFKLEISPAQAEEEPCCHLSEFFLQDTMNNQFCNNFILNMCIRYI